jgi:hypothetical protein
MKLTVFLLVLGFLGNAYGDPTPVTPTVTKTPDQRILVYHTAEIYHGEVQNPAKAQVEPFVISQIRVWAEDNQIELREDPTGNDVGFTLFYGHRSKDLPGDLSLPDLKEECEKFFQIK